MREGAPKEQGFCAATTVIYQVVSPVTPQPASKEMIKFSLSVILARDFC